MAEENFDFEGGREEMEKKGARQPAICRKGHMWEGEHVDQRLSQKLSNVEYNGAYTTRTLKGNAVHHLSKEKE